MKRATALLTCTLLVASLAACSSDGGVAGSGVVDSGTGAPATSSAAGTTTAGDASGSVTADGSTASTASTASTSSTAGSDSSGAAPGPSPEDVTIADMLALVPATAPAYPTGNPSVTINLYWKAAAAGGVTVPDASDTDAQADYAMDLSYKLDKHIGMAGTDLFSQLATPAYSAGAPIALSDVAADAQAGQPPHITIAARGDFDTDAIDAAFRDDATWKDELTTPSYHGHTFYRWLDDLKIDMTKVNTGLFTTLGNSRRMAFPDPSTFLYSRDDDTMHALLDTGDDPSAISLAADRNYVAVADALDRNGVYSAMIVGPQPLSPLVASNNLSPEQAKKVLAEMREHALGPYLLAGIGATLVDGSPRTVIVLANSDADAAQTNAEALRGLITDGQSMQSQRPWSDYFGIDSVTTDGSLTVGVLTLADPTRVTTWYQAVLQRDTLLASDG